MGLVNVSASCKVLYRYPPNWKYVFSFGFILLLAQTPSSVVKAAEPNLIVGVRVLSLKSVLSVISSGVWISEKLK